MSTRSRAKPTKSTETHRQQKHFDTKVFLIDGCLINETSENVEIVTLRNPSTEKSSKYLYAKHLTKFFEIMSFNEEPRSWFINDVVQPNGQLYLTTAFDPLFWGLYYLRLNNSDKCQPIEQSFIDDNFANTHLIVNVLTADQLSMIGDQKGDKSLKAFKYNESKALIWLSIKCQNLMKCLKEKNFHIGAKSVNYVKAEKFDDSTQNVDGELLSYAYGIVSEYITVELSEKLSEHLGLEKIKPMMAGKRKSLIDLEHKTLKRIKSEDNVSLDYIEPPTVATPIKEKKVSTKDKALAKAASGTKSISSFFTKK